MFSQCAKDCANLASILTPDKIKSYKDLFFLCNFPNVDMANEALPPALKPVVLVLFVEMCCGERLRIFSRPAFPTVYTLKGTLIVTLFHAQCKICRTTYYYSYKEKSHRDGKHFPAVNPVTAVPTRMGLLHYEYRSNTVPIPNVYPATLQTCGLPSGHDRH